MLSIGYEQIKNVLMIVTPGPLLTTRPSGREVYQEIKKIDTHHEPIPPSDNRILHAGTCPSAPTPNPFSADGCSVQLTLPKNSSPPSPPRSARLLSNPPREDDSYPPASNSAETGGDAGYVCRGGRDMG